MKRKTLPKSVDGWKLKLDKKKPLENKKKMKSEKEQISKIQMSIFYLLMLFLFAC